MMAMSAGVTLESKAEGGVMKSLKRAALGGESFFISTYTAPAQGGFVDVAARLPGDIAHYTVDPAQALFISKGSWMANEQSVTVNTQWGGFKNMFGAEGGFILRAEGSGQVVFACYGALEVWNLQAGQHITVDTGHMVAYEDSVQMAIRQAGGGVVKMFKSGEGLVFDFSGPGGSGRRPATRTNCSAGSGRRWARAAAAARPSAACSAGADACISSGSSPPRATTRATSSTSTSSRGSGGCCSRSSSRC